VTVQGIRCHWCKDEVWSRHRWDCRRCKCGKTYVDGGRDYLRIGFDGEDGKPDIITIDTEAVR
jgi:hypothetical protein